MSLFCCAVLIVEQAVLNSDVKDDNNVALLPIFYKFCLKISLEETDNHLREK
jgi:hypothetical protein